MNHTELLRPGWRHLPASAITPKYVEERSGGDSLYCAIHRTFHDSSTFSQGSTGQARQPSRYCMKCTAHEKANFNTLANVKPSEEGIKEGARRLNAVLTGMEAEAVAQQRASRVSARAVAQPVPVKTKLPSAKKRRVGTRLRKAQQQLESKPKETENARLFRIWTSRAGHVFTSPESFHVVIDEDGKKRRRRGRAVDVPLCASLAAQLARLQALRESGVLRWTKVCGVVWCGVVWRGVVGRGAVLCGVEWRGAAQCGDV